MIRCSKPIRGERGYILIWVLFYFALFYLLALSFMDASMLESLISINHHRDVQAFAMADGGALMGAEQIYNILTRDYSASQEIPEQLTLDQQEWTFNEAGRNFRFFLKPPRRVSQADGECRFRFISQGFCTPTKKTVIVEVRVKYRDYYLIPYGADEAALLVFDHRDFIYPAQITSLEI